MIQHRPVADSDIEIICTFPRNAEELFYFYPKAAHPLTPDQLKTAIDQRRDSTVVELDDQVVGFANFFRWENGRCTIGNLIVRPSARGRGVAKYLITIMVRLAKSRHGAHTVQISCFNQNTTGLLLYQKLGFEPFAIEERQAADGRRSALVHMRLATTDEEKA